MKDAYASWAKDLFDGMAIEAKDGLGEGEARLTVIILAGLQGCSIPTTRQTIYFEILEALGQLQSLNTDVHLYLFDPLPASPTLALRQLDRAKAQFACTTSATLKRHVASEIEAQWHIDNRMVPILKRAPSPFRPPRHAGMQQVCVDIADPLTGRFDYRFDPGRVNWVPELDKQRVLRSERHRAAADGARGQDRDRAPADRSLL